MSRTICRLSSQREQAGLRLIIGLSDLSQVFQCRRITYATLEDVTVAATVLRMEGNSRQGIELLNVSHQQQNPCLEVPYLILKENKNICLIQKIHGRLTCSQRQLAMRNSITDADLCSM